MSVPFEIREIFISGPGVKEVTKVSQGLGLVMRPADVATIIFRGKVPFRKDLHYPARNDAALKITPSRFMRSVAFEFCGTEVDERVDVVATCSTLEEVGEAVRPFVDYVHSAFRIV